jgi:hypothetical protein
MSTLDVSGDRALLEAAARAAGIADASYIGLANGGSALYIKGEGVWAPLTDDADAFRLAVKLRLHVDCARSGGVTVWVLDGDGAHDFDEHSEDHFADTRRAIVRAAASLPT